MIIRLRQTFSIVLPDRRVYAEIEIYNAWVALLICNTMEIFVRFPKCNDRNHNAPIFECYMFTGGSETTSWTT